MKPGLLIYYFHFHILKYINQRLSTHVENYPFIIFHQSLIAKHCSRKGFHGLLKFKIYCIFTYQNELESNENEQIFSRDYGEKTDFRKIFS